MSSQPLDQTHQTAARVTESGAAASVGDETEAEMIERSRLLDRTVEEGLGETSAVRYLWRGLSWIF